MAVDKAEVQHMIDTLREVGEVTAGDVESYYVFRTYRPEQVSALLQNAAEALADLDAQVDMLTGETGFVSGHTSRQLWDRQWELDHPEREED